MLTERQQAAVSVLKTLPAYNGWSDDEIHGNINEVISSGDTNRISGLTKAVSGVQNYSGWQPQEIESNLREVFQTQQTAQPVMRNTAPTVYRSKNLAQPSQTVEEQFQPMEPTTVKPLTREELKAGALPTSTDPNIAAIQEQRARPEAFVPGLVQRVAAGGKRLIAGEMQKVAPISVSPEETAAKAQQLKEEAKIHGKAAEVIDPTWYRSEQVQEKVNRIREKNPNIVNSLEMGDASGMSDIVVFNAFLGGDDAAKQQALQMARTVREVAGERAAKQKTGFVGGIENVLNSTAEMLPMLGKSAALGAVPVVGPALVSSMWVQQGTGDVITGLKEEGVEDDVALAYGLLGAVPYAAVEQLQIGQILGPVGKKAVANSIRKRIAKIAVEKGKDLFKEMAEEGLQAAILENVTIGALRESGIEVNDANKRMVGAFIQDFKASAGPMGVLSLLGFGAGAAGKISARKQAAKPAEAAKQEIVPTQRKGTTLAEMGIQSTDDYYSLPEKQRTAIFNQLSDAEQEKVTRAYEEPAEMPIAEKPPERAPQEEIAPAEEIVRPKIGEMTEEEVRQVLRLARGIPKAEAQAVSTEEAQEVLAKAKEETRTAAGAKMMEGTKYDRQHGEELATQVPDVTFKGIQPGFAKGETRQPVRLLFDDEASGTTFAIKATDTVDELKKRIEEVRAENSESVAKNIAEKIGGLEYVRSVPAIEAETKTGYTIEKHHEFKTENGDIVTIKPGDNVEKIKSYIERKAEKQTGKQPAETKLTTKAEQIQEAQPLIRSTKKTDILLNQYIKNGESEGTISKEIHRNMVDLLDRAAPTDIARELNIPDNEITTALNDVRANKQTENSIKIRQAFAPNLAYGQTVDQVMDELSGGVSFSKKPSYEKIIAMQRATEGFIAAIKDPETGKIYTGWTHQAAIDSAPSGENVWGRLYNEWDQSSDNVGFVDKNGNFINRSDADKKYAIQTMEDLKDLRSGKEESLVRLFHGKPQFAKKEKEFKISPEREEKISGLVRESIASTARQGAAKVIPAEEGEFIEEEIKPGITVARNVRKSYNKGEEAVHGEDKLSETDLGTPEEKRLVESVYRSAKKEPQYGTIRIVEGETPYRQIAKIVAEQTGDPVKLIESDQEKLQDTLGFAFDGFRHRGTIYLDINTERPLLWTAYHEWYHGLTPKQKQFISEAAEITEAGLKERMATGGEEFMADIAGEMMARPETIKYMAEKDPGTFRTILNDLIEILNSVVDRVKKLIFGNTELRPMYEKYLKNAETVRDKLIAVLEENSGEEIQFAEKRTEFAKQKSDIFFSPLLKATQVLKQHKGTGEQMFNMLTKTPGVKEAEWKWIWLDDFLKGKQSVTKGEIEDFVRQNQVRVEEVEKGASGKETFKRDEAYREFENGKTVYGFDEEGTWTGTEQWVKLKEEDFNRYGQFKIADKKPDTKYSQYQLPGGENYREVLLKLPVTVSSYLNDDKIVDAIKNIENDGWVITNKESGIWDWRYEKDGDDVDIWGLRDESEKGEVLFNSIKNNFDKNEERINKKNIDIYRSSHWEEPNVIAHVRLNDREVNGEKVLFIEEIQSDWAREAREKGVKDGNRLPPGYRIGENIPEDRDARPYALYDENGNRLLTGITVDEIYERMNRPLEPGYSSPSHDSRVSAQPFLKNWEELTLKRILRMAAEEGYDRVAWINGSETASRYDLSKQLESLSWVKNKDGTFDVHTWISEDTPGPSFTGETLQALEGKIGKGVTQKIGAESKDKEGPFGGVLRGKELSIKPEWPFNLYDRMVPKFLEKYGKRWNTKTENVDLGIKNKKGEDVGPLGSIPITPEMRESVLYEGQPMFAKKRQLKVDQTETPEFKKWFGEGQKGANANNSGRPMPLYHGTTAEFTSFKESKDGAVGPGIYLSKTSDLSNSFAGSKEGSNVMMVYARGKYLKIPYGEIINGKEWNTKAREQGYDGLDTGLGELVVFDTKNIKSATGQGLKQQKGPYGGGIRRQSPKSDISFKNKNNVRYRLSDYVELPLHWSYGDYEYEIEIDETDYGSWNQFEGKEPVYKIRREIQDDREDGFQVWPDLKSVLLAATGEDRDGSYDDLKYLLILDKGKQNSKGGVGEWEVYNKYDIEDIKAIPVKKIVKYISKEIGDALENHEWTEVDKYIEENEYVIYEWIIDNSKFVNPKIVENIPLSSEKKKESEYLFGEYNETDERERESVLYKGQPMFAKKRQLNERIGAAGETPNTQYYRLKDLEDKVRELKKKLGKLRDDTYEKRATIEHDLENYDEMQRDKLQGAIYDYANRIGLRGEPNNRVATLLKNARTANDFRKAVEVMDEVVKKRQHRRYQKAAEQAVTDAYTYLKRITGKVRATTDLESNKFLQEYLDDIIGGDEETRRKADMMVAYYNQYGNKDIVQNRDSYVDELGKDVVGWIENPGDSPAPADAMRLIKSMAATGLEKKSNLELLEIIRDIREIRRTGRLAKREEDKRRRAELEQKADIVAKDIEKNTKTKPGTDFEQAVEESFKKGKVKRSKEAIKAAAAMVWEVMDAERILQKMAGARGRSLIKRMIFDPMYDADNRKKRNVKKALDWFKGNYRGIDIGKARTETFMDLTGEVEGEAGTYATVGTMPITYEQGMMIYAMSKNPAQREHLIWTLATQVTDKDEPNKKTRDDLNEARRQMAEATIDSVVNALPDKYKRAVEGQWKYYDENQHQRLSEEFAKEHGIPMPKEAFYFPLGGILKTNRADNQVVADLMARIGARRAGVQKGMTLSRVNSRAALKNLKYFDAVAGNMLQTEHYIAFNDAVRQVNRVLMQPKLRKAMQGYSPEATRQVEDWLKSIAYGKLDYGTGQSAMDKTVRWLRKNYAVYQLGLRATSVMMQTASYFRGLSQVSKADAVKAYGRMVKNPKRFFEAIDALSPQMEARTTDYEQGIAEWAESGTIDKMLGIQKAGSKIRDAVMAPMGMMDKFWAGLLWDAKYNEQLKKGASQADAIYSADELIRKTQSGGGLLSSTGMMRGGELKRAFTQFASDPIKGLNMLIEFGNHFNELSTNEKMQWVALGFVAPALVTYFIRSGFRPPWEEPEEVVKEVVRSFADGIPFYGAAIDMATSAALDKIKEHRGMPVDKFMYNYMADIQAPAFSAPQAAIEGIPKAMEGEPWKLIDGISQVVGVPAGGQLTRTIKSGKIALEHKNAKYLIFNRRGASGEFADVARSLGSKNVKQRLWAKKQIEKWPEEKKQKFNDYRRTEKKQRRESNRKRKLKQAGKK